MPALKNILYFSLLLLLVASCKKDDGLMPICTPDPDPDPDPDPVELPYTLLDCNDSQATISFLEDLSTSGILIESITSDTANYILNYENDSVYAMALTCIEQINPNPEDWLTEFVFTDAATTNLGSYGSIKLEATLDPSTYAPLTADLNVSAAVPGLVNLRVIGKNGPFSDIAHSFTELSDDQTVSVLGLYPDYANVVEVAYLSEAGKVRAIDSIEIATGALPAGMPVVEVTKREEGEMATGLNLISYRFLVNPNIPLMVDAYGEVRWYLYYEDHPELDKMNYINGIERLKNGNLYFCNAADELIYEVDMYGRVQNTWTIPSPYLFHHDVHEKQDGNFLVTVTSLNSIHLNGNGCKEDFIIEIDRYSDDVVMVWDLKEPLDEYRITMEDNLDNDPIDWIHVNAVIDDPSDNTIIISGRQQGIFKIDYSNQVIWALGVNSGWGQNRYGQDMNDYVLTAVDANGEELAQSFQEGIETHPDFEWPWYQHAPFIMPNGNIMLFDNGVKRNFDNQLKYSRAVEYSLDVSGKLVQEVWEYGEERGLETLSGIASDVDYLEEKDNVLFMPCDKVPNSGGLLGGKIVEVDYNSRNVVFEAEISSPGITFFQCERLPIYPD